MSRTVIAAAIASGAALATAPTDDLTPAPAAWTDAKRAADSWVDDRRTFLEATSRTLWEYVVVVRTGAEEIA